MVDTEIFKPTGLSISRQVNGNRKENQEQTEKEIEKEIVDSKGFKDPNEDEAINVRQWQQKKLMMRKTSSKKSLQSK